MAEPKGNPTARALSLARLPDGLEARRVLAVGAGELDRDRLTAIGASELQALERPSEGFDPGDGFDLVLCGSGLATDAHPLALYAWLRRATRPEGVLIAGSRVLADPAKSQYARFEAAAAAAGAPRWIPGRLAFRWMVEVSGFDVVAWLDGSSEPAEGSAVAYLQATAVERAPALDLERQPLPAET